MATRLTRRSFLWLGSLSGVGFICPLKPTEAIVFAQKDAQRTLEALMNVLLPGEGTHGTAPDEPGALSSRLYGLPVYEQLTDEYFLAFVDPEVLDRTARDLDLGAHCFGLLTSSFADLADEKQLGLLAYGTRLDDEGEPPFLTPVEKACLRLGGQEGNSQGAVDLMRFIGLIFFTSNPALDWLKQKGYPGPNWGFNPAKGWAQVEEPPF